MILRKANRPLSLRFQPRGQTFRFRVFLRLRRQVLENTVRIPFNGSDLQTGGDALCDAERR